MTFEIIVTDSTPLTSVDDAEEVAARLLRQVGYFPRSYDSAASTEALKLSIPFRLFMGCFMKRQDKVWKVDDLAIALDTTKPTVYRHINKLKALDLLEEMPTEQDGNKGYRIRYGDLSKAWNFTEAHVEVAVQNYRKSVDHLQELMGTKNKRRR